MSSALQNTADRANIDDDIANVAKLIGKSKQRRAVFTEIYRGKKGRKTVDEVATAIKLPRKRVLEEAKRFVDHKFVSQLKVKGETTYAKDPALNRHKAKILAAAGDKKKQAALPTRAHVGGGGFSVQIRLKQSNPKPRQITVDHVASFKLVRKVGKPDPTINLSKLREERIKAAFKKMLGETHEFKDWGGEKNDLFSNKLCVTAQRKTVAFAFKGRGTSGPLTPKKMGHNGDQISRLFGSAADVFFVVYHGKIDESIHMLMRVHAIALSLGGRRVSYGVIDGDDLNRLYQAYREYFGSLP